MERSSLLEINDKEVCSDKDSSQDEAPIQTQLNSARIIKSNKRTRIELTQTTIEDESVTTVITKCQGTYSIIIKNTIYIKK